MNIKRWIARREGSWQQLEALLKQAEVKGLASLNAREISSLASLYRSVSGDLARARTHNMGETLVQELQLLTARSYRQIYQGSRRQESESIWEFYRWGLPATLRLTLPYILLATAIFGGAGIIGWWFAWRDPKFMTLLLPDSMISMVRDQGQLWMGRILTDQPGSSAGIMVNNIRLCFYAVAGGIVAGFYSIYILFLNGLLIGTVGALVGQNNLALPFWAFVFPHGSLELPAIFISGAAGLLLARALLFPGRLRRADAFQVYGEQAAHLVFGVVPMLVIAGIIEGFISPSPIVPDILKYGIGVALFVGLLKYGERRKPGV
ncbi:MAG: hypothetical protein CV045_04635 [Cyanobacteria bacterium M5B4]|nr:MAG: hypothetical protein CV045_04635 [Cyanobacteria bacterium M5B4]